MDFLDQYEALAFWLQSYGSLALFALLALGIVALPIPEETLLVFAGLLLSKGKLHAGTTILAAILGSITGISTSYIIGRTLGKYALLHYFGWAGMTENKLRKAHQWFEVYGKWLLLFGYFIPGVRHFTGVVAGMAYLEYPVFALFAYLGAVMWVVTFLSIGFFFVDYWSVLFNYIETRLEQLIIFALLTALLYLVIRYLLKSNK